MNEIVNKDTFTSLELIDLINLYREQEGIKGKLRHDNLLQIIRNEFEEEISLLKIQESKYKNNRGKEYPMYILNLAQSRQVLVRESKFVRKSVIEYINKLEEELNTFKLPKTYKEALIALVEAEEEKEKRLAEIEIMKPKVEGYDAFLSSEAGHSFSEAAKVIGVGRNTLFKILRNKGILMQNNIPYQDFMKYFVVVDIVVNKENYKNITQKTIITTKGMDWLLKKLKEWGIK